MCANEREREGEEALNLTMYLPRAYAVRTCESHMHFDFNRFTFDLHIYEFGALAFTHKASLH